MNDLNKHIKRYIPPEHIEAVWRDMKVREIYKEASEVRKHKKKPVIKLTGVQPDYVHGKYVKFRVPKGTKLIIDAPTIKKPCGTYSGRLSSGKKPLFTNLTPIVDWKAKVITRCPCWGKHGFVYCEGGKDYSCQCGLTVPTVEMEKLIARKNG